MNRDKNIVVTTSTYPRWEKDSTPRFIQDFCHQVAQYYNAVHVLAPHAKGARRNERHGNVYVKRYRYMYPASAQNIVYGGGGVFKIKMTPVYAVKLMGLVLSQLLNLQARALSKKTAIISAHWIIPQGFIAVLVKMVTRKKVVVSVHGSDIFALNNGLMRKVKRFVLKRADYVVANSSASKEACQDVYPDVKITVVPMGTNVDYFKPMKKPRDIVSKYGLEDTFTILFVGRLTKVKGLVYLCEALNGLKKSGAKYKALMVGDGPERPKLEAYVKEHGLADYVTFVGWIDSSRLVEYYNVADVLVGPSLSEAFGLVFVESLASGTPVIVSDVDGVSDIVKDGETGFLVKPKSPKDLHQKIKTLYDDPALRNEMASKGRDSVVRSFSWDSVTKRYAQLFDKLIEPESRN